MLFRVLFDLKGSIECFGQKVGTYIISDDNEAQIREWMKVLRAKCSNFCKLIAIQSFGPFNPKELKNLICVKTYLSFFSIQANF